MESKNILFKNPNMSRLKDFLEKHHAVVVTDGPDSLRVDDVQAVDARVMMAYRDFPDLDSIIVKVKSMQDHPEANFCELLHLVNHINEADNPGKFAIDATDFSLLFTRYYTNYVLRVMDFHQLLADVLIPFSQCEEMVNAVAQGKSVDEVLAKLDDQD